MISDLDISLETKSPSKSASSKTMLSLDEEPQQKAFDYMVGFVHDIHCYPVSISKILPLSEAGDQPIPALDKSKLVEDMTTLEKLINDRKDIRGVVSSKKLSPSKLKLFSPRRKIEDIDTAYVDSKIAEAEKQLKEMRNALDNGSLAKVNCGSRFVAHTCKVFFESNFANSDFKIDSSAKEFDKMVSSAMGRFVNNIAQFGMDQLILFRDIMTQLDIVKMRGVIKAYQDVWVDQKTSKIENDGKTEDNKLEQTMRLALYLKPSFLHYSADWISLENLDAMRILENSPESRQKYAVYCSVIQDRFPTIKFDFPELGASNFNVKLNAIQNLLTGEIAKELEVQRRIPGTSEIRKAEKKIIVLKDVDEKGNEKDVNFETLVPVNVMHQIMLDLDLQEKKDEIERHRNIVKRELARQAKK